MTAKPYSATTNGIRLAVRLTPRASRNGLDGIGLDADGRPVLRIRLTAPPVEGAGRYQENNFTTLCFCMHGGYRPPSVALAIEKRHLSRELILHQDKFVLAVPGPALAEAAMYCGMKSGRDVDKAAELKLRLTSAKERIAPWLVDALANVELTKIGMLDAGDHDIILGRVDSYNVNSAAVGPNLISVGREHCGYEVLIRQGMHRIGVVSSGR